MTGSKFASMIHAIAYDSKLRLTRKFLAGSDYAPFLEEKADRLNMRFRGIGGEVITVYRTGTILYQGKRRVQTQGQLEAFLFETFYGPRKAE